MDFVKRILDTTLSKYRSKCPTDITDLVFLEIEKNYMNEYKNACNFENPGTINQEIGRFVKTYWNLNNLERCYNPNSNLIGSFRKH